MKIELINTDQTLPYDFSKIKKVGQNLYQALLNVMPSNFSLNMSINCFFKEIRFSIYENNNSGNDNNSIQYLLRYG